jgi:CBS domain-containing membrane protein
MDLASQPVSRIMRTRFVSVRDNERLSSADLIMNFGRVRHLPVLDEAGRLVGIVSNRDLLEASLSDVLDFEAEHRRAFLRSVDIGEVMTREVETVQPDTPLGVAAARLIAHRIGCLPVVDREGVVVGIVTETDLLIAAYARKWEDEPAAQVERAAGERTPG